MNNTIWFQDSKTAGGGKVTNISVTLFKHQKKKKIYYFKMEIASMALAMLSQTPEWHRYKAVISIHLFLC
jgi:hypothetical protein